ncbi:MAG: trimethylamine methyltransferase family protein, partial [Actinobacteria bacterium]|nr:trimethylamine methyltransferase family protein [Actinomycetota bacterium]
ALHDGAISVLETVGIEVAHEGARDLLLANGGKLEEEILIKIPRELVESSLASTPSSFSLYDRHGNEAIQLGAGKTYYGAGVTNLAYLDIEGDRHDFTLDDIGKVAFLADALPNIDFVATPGVIKPDRTTRVELLDQMAFLQMVSNTTMPLVVLTPDAYQMEDIFEMAEFIAGGREALSAKPFIMPYLNSVSPLVCNPETCDKLFLAADHGIPVCVQAAPPVGGSVPVTIAAGLVVGAAETLMGLVLSQLRNPGTPFVSGVVPFVMDMRSGNTATTSPDIMSMQIAMGELTRSWGVPSLTSGAGSDSKIPDEQAGFEVPYYTQGPMLGGVDMSFSAGRLECGLLHSPVLLVYADEAIGMHKRFMRGLEVDETTLALDVIKEVGPGGFFVGHQHTRDHFRELWEPTLTSWEPRDMWESRGSTTMLERTTAKVRKLREDHAVEPIPKGVLAEMQAVIDRREAILPEDD